MDFASFILDLSHGEVNQALSEKLEEVIAAVSETSKVGAITVKLKIKKEGAMAVAHCDSSVKMPEPDMPPSMFFFSQDGKGLQREDPRQLSLREVVTPSQPLRTVNGDDE